MNRKKNNLTKFITTKKTSSTEKERKSNSHSPPKNNMKFHYNKIKEIAPGLKFIYIYFSTF